MDIVSITLTVVVLLSSLWLFYNTPAFIIGFSRWIKNKKSGQKNPETHDPPSNYQPKVSIIVPAKNEEKVIERLLKALVDLDYPQKEIILIEDGSTDKTPQICRKWATKHPSVIMYLHNSASNGKPSAINRAAKEATGEIIAGYDADTILEPSTLRRIIPHFEDPEVAAVQGELRTVNPDESVITRLAVLNDFVVNIQQLGKDRLNAFVPLLGTNQYIRRNVLEEVGYWDSEALSEDTEISVRLARKGYKVKYVLGATGVEAPAKLRIFIRQRMKWLRGYTQAVVKHKDMVRTPNRKTLDAYLTLIFPIMLILGLVGYVGALYSIARGATAIPILQTIGIALLVLNLLSPAMFVSTNPRNAVYVPLFYLDWILLAFVSLYVHIRALLGKPQKWTRTPKSGHVTIKPN